VLALLLFLALVDVVAVFDGTGAVRCSQIVNHRSIRPNKASSVPEDCSVAVLDRAKIMTPSTNTSMPTTILSLRSILPMFIYIVFCLLTVLKVALAVALRLV
jgi:hypothetical protein